VTSSISKTSLLSRLSNLIDGQMSKGLCNIVPFVLEMLPCTFVILCHQTHPSFSRAFALTVSHMHVRVHMIVRMHVSVYESLRV
jgi:hypothetical protein